VSASLLAGALDRFETDDPGEQADLALLRSLAATPDPWDRRQPLHVTASALVLHPPTARVLLRRHERLARWLHVGGHGDPGEQDPFAIAMREATEESGLTDLAAWPEPTEPALIHVVVVDVPASAREPAHRHGDVRYLLATATPERAQPESPSAPLRWAGFDEAIDLVGTDNLVVALRRARSALVTPPPG
jgi:8-oxo-dGTP pyrophosphatase MutT (NUDIX family)